MDSKILDTDESKSDTETYTTTKTEPANSANSTWHKARPYGSLMINQEPVKITTKTTRRGRRSNLFRISGSKQVPLADTDEE